MLFSDTKMHTWLPWIRFTSFTDGVKKAPLIKFSFSEKATKNVCNLPHGLEIYLVNVQTMRKIAEIFVAFSEKLNFNDFAIFLIIQVTLTGKKP